MISSQTSAQQKITVGILDPIWAPPDTILPIDATEITNSAEASLSIADEIYKGFPDSALMARYANDLIDFEESLDSLQREIEQHNLEEIGSGMVQNYISQLTILQSSFAGVKSELEKTTKKLQSNWVVIDYMVRTWETTINADQGQTQNEPLISRSENILSDLRQQRDIIRGLTDEVLIIDDNLLTLKQSLEKTITLMIEAEEIFKRNYLTKSHPALWEKDTLVSVEYREIVRSALKAYDTGLSSFYSVNKPKIYILLGLFLFFLISTFFIRSKLRKRSHDLDDQRINVFFKVFSKPVAVSLTLSIFIALVSNPNSPSAVKDVLAFLLIVPLLIVSLQVLPKKTHNYLYAISSLFLVSELVDTIKYGSFPLPYYLILVVLTIFLAYIIWLIIRRSIKLRNTVKSRIEWIDLILWISFFIILAADISVAFGYVALGFFLFTGIVVSIMAGLLLLVSLTIMEGFFKLVIMGNDSHMYGRVREYGDKLLLRIIRVLKLAATIYWIGLVLRSFLIYAPLIDWFKGIMESKWVVGTVSISLNGIVLFGVILFISIWISRFLRLVLDKEIFPRVKMGRGVPGMISLIIRVVIITIGIFMSLGVLGVDFNKLTILMGALGVGIGFGLQDIINNLISGFILVFERPIQVGDTVQFGDREGKVKEIGIRSSTIKTYDGSEVIVPNGKLISNELINLTLSDPILRVEIDVGTEYGSNPQEVIDILVMQAKLHPDVTQHPESFAIFLGFGDYSLNFRLYAYTLEVNARLRIRSELNLAIYQALEEAKIKIPFPIQDLNVQITDKKDNG